MKNHPTIVLLFVVLALTGCQKKSEKELRDPSSCLVKNEVLKDATGNLIATVQYEYDDFRRITNKTIIPGSSHPSMTIRYEYSGSKIVETLHDFGGTILIKTTYHLNEQGLAIASYIDSYSDTPVSQLNSKFEYDKEGHLIKQSSFSGGTTVHSIHSWEIKDGNIASYVSYNSEYNPQISETYSYFTNLVNSIGNDNKGVMFFGKSSKNLTMSSTVTSSAGTETANYTYEFDQYNRVTRMVIEGKVLFTTGRIISFEYY